MFHSSEGPLYFVRYAVNVTFEEYYYSTCNLIFNISQRIFIWWIVKWIRRLRYKRIEFLYTEANTINVW